MQVRNTVDGVFCQEKTAVALGLFDGLHLGHAAVISRAVQEAENGLCPCVFTFTLHGGKPVGKDNAGMLLTERMKLRLLEDWGVRLVLSPDFSEFRGMPPEDFVKRVLVDALNAGAVCCGYDFHFGRGAHAGVEQLSELCAQQGIALHVIPPVTVGGERISSTGIRALLEQGNTEQAAAMLGRAFSFDFPVVRGKQLGRKLGFPTINQLLPDDFIRLRRGVYASVSLVHGVPYPSVTNIGVRPTTDAGDQRVFSETCIHGFTGELYGEYVEVCLLHFQRTELIFASVEEMQTQIQRDLEQALPAARQYLHTRT